MDGVDVFGEAFTNEIPTKRIKDPSNQDVPDGYGVQAHDGAFAANRPQPCNDSSIISAKVLSIMTAKAGQVTFG
ncbi:MAG: hypothetical protein WBA29_07300 [Xanthobacteraceae bacterium]